MIRLSSVELHYFKNVEYGRVDFGSSHNGGSITGIYGQNGSGKTAVVEALGCIKNAMSGFPQERNSADFIDNAASDAKIVVAYRIDLHDEGGDISGEVEYEVRFAKGEDGGLKVVDETLSLKRSGEKKRVLIKHSLATAVDGSSPSFNWEYAPIGKWRSIRAFDSHADRLFAMAEGASVQDGSSFIFSDGFVRGLLTFWKAQLEKGEQSEGREVPETVKRAASDTVSILIPVVIALMEYARNKTYVLPTVRSSAISFNLLILSTVGDEQRGGFHATVGLGTDAPTLLALDDYERLCDTVERINGVLGALIPGYSVEAKDLGPATLDEGREGRRVELLSNRNRRKLPFRCESEGIQKITAIAALLVDVYNDSDSCVVIDELDSGVFEFLLGELLEVLAGKGKGQLIFTAHNLRALETLPPKSLVFTTSNPSNRYVHFKGIRPSNNLRDQYLRAINLGGQDEEIYEPTDRFAIDSAFYRAGHHDETPFEDLLEELRG